MTWQAAPDLIKPLLKSPKVQPPQSKEAEERGLLSFKGGYLHEDPAAMTGGCVWPHAGASVIPSSALVRPPGHCSQEVSPMCSPPTPERCPGHSGPTWGAKAEGIGRAEAAAANPGSEGDLVLS